jgi:precorrin-6B methylase 2
MEHLKLAEQDKKVILVCAKHEYVITGIESALSKIGFGTISLIESEDMLRAIKNLDFDAIFFGGGIPPLTKVSITDHLRANKPGIKIIDFIGGPANIKEEVLKVLSP